MIEPEVVFRKRIKNISTCYSIVGDGIARIELKEAMKNEQFRRRIRKMSDIKGNFDTSNPFIASISSKN